MPRRSKRLQKKAAEEIIDLTVQEVTESKKEVVKPKKSKDLKTIQEENVDSHQSKEVIDLTLQDDVEAKNEIAEPKNNENALETSKVNNISSDIKKETSDSKSSKEVTQQDSSKEFIESEGSLIIDESETQQPKASKDVIEPQLKHENNDTECNQETVQPETSRSINDSQSLDNTLDSKSSSRINESDLSQNTISSKSSTEGSQIPLDPSQQTVRYVHQPEKLYFREGRDILGLSVTGVVKWYNVRAGYGFISTDRLQADVFVHESAIIKKNPRVFKTSLGDGERVRFDVLVGRKGMPEAANVTGPNGGYVMGSRYALDWRRQRSNKSGMREYSSRIDEKLSRYYDEFSDSRKYENGKQSRNMESNRRKRHQRSQEHKKAKRRKLGSQDILDKRTSDRSRTCPDRMNGNRSSNNRIDYEDEKRMRKRARNRRKRHNYTRNVRARKLRVQELERELQGQSSTGDYDKYIRI